MAKRVNNISYNGIRHTPSLVSDADGYASECANLSPDGNDLKPTPMPVKVDGYTVTPNAKVIFVHLGVGYKNYVELDADGIRLYLRDEEGNYLYYADPNSGWWLNESEVLSVEAIGDTLIVSTKGGTEYLVYRPDDELYKWLGQKPPMPVIEFGMRNGDNDAYTDLQIGIHIDGDESITVEQIDDDWWFAKAYEPILQEFVNGMISKLNTEMTADNKFNQPFLVRYAYRMKTGDYTMQSPPVLMLPSTKKCPYLCRAVTGNGSPTQRPLMGFFAATKCARLQYKISARPNLDDWKDIISGVDVFVTTPIYNYDTECSTDAAIKPEGIPKRKLPLGTDIDFGQIYANGDIEGMYEHLPTSIPEYLFTEDPAAFYKIKSVDGNIFDANVRNATVFHKVSSIDIDSLFTNGAYKDLPIESLTNLATMPTLPDDYNSHCAVSASLMQVYNSRLNMANISQMVFDGFGNAYQPQSNTSPRHYHGVVNYLNPGHVPVYGDIDVKSIMLNVRKNGKVYTVSPNNADDDPGERLDYTSYIYYPDADCFEAVVYCSISYGGLTYWRYYTMPMTRHEHLNGSFWYSGTDCLGEYIASQYRIGEGSSTSPVTISSDTWYDIPNRFMMSSVGNPWHFPVGNQFDIGRREIRALSINAENMDAPQFGQNPIYVFSADGIWTIDINADGTFRKLNYVSGDVISEMDGIGGSPTASAQQATFFKTERGIMAITRSQVKDISLAMKGRIFNPIMRLLPMHSVKEGIPLDGSLSRWRDLIDGVCDNIPFADFAKESSLLYDYRNDRLLLLPGNKAIKYMYVYDVHHDFWSKMMMLPNSSNDEEEESQGGRGADTQQDVSFTNSAMDGSMALLQDADGNLWQVGGQPDENDINTRQFGFYVSRPLRFGTDDMKTLSRIVHDQQLSIADEKVRMALYGSRDGRNYYRVDTLRGTSYKFFVMVLYTHILPSSRYAYTAFEWEARMTDKIR